ncbi:MAG: phosphate ABC transporter permease subunit PstC [Pseudomonadota bacterium]
MDANRLLILVCLLACGAYLLGRHRAYSVSGGAIRKLRSLPGHYGFYSLILTAVPALALLLCWSMLAQPVIDSMVLAELPADMQGRPAAELELLLNDVKNSLQGVGSGTGSALVGTLAERYTELLKNSNLLLWILTLALTVAGMGWAWKHIRLDYPAQHRVERAIVYGLIGCSLLAIFTTIGIVLSVLFESLRFFHAVPITDFLFGLEWSPQTAIRSDQVGSSGAFGAIPLFTGTLLISTIAMLVAFPIGLMSSIYLAEYADQRARAVLKPVLEILAGIPTVVYGFFAALFVAPMLRGFGHALGLTVASESALAAGLVMGIMIVPFVSSISDDVITAVPNAMREGSYGLGATKSETIRKVIIPAALPGIVGGVLLAVSRAIGETMIVVMAAGLAANLTANPLEAVTTVTVQIVTLLVGDQEFDSPKTLAAFALGLVLFVVTLVLNIIALHVVRRYREQYE